MECVNIQASLGELARVSRRPDVQIICKPEGTAGTALQGIPKGPSSSVVVRPKP